MDGQAEPILAFGPVRLPVAVIGIPRFEVALSNGLIGVLKAHLRNRKALFRYPGFALVAVPLVEVGHIRMLERAHFVAHDRRWLYQFDFFRHDFVLAAIAADFEGGGSYGLQDLTCLGRGQAIQNHAAYCHGVRNGNVVVYGEGNLTLNNSAIPAVGGNVPAIILCPDNDISLSGSIDVQALSTATMATLTGSMSFGPQKFFPCTAQKTDNTYINVNLFASGTSLLLNYPVAGLKSIDISPFRVKR